MARGVSAALRVGGYAALEGFWLVVSGLPWNYLR